MSEEILNKVKFLCRSIDRVEWSGALFYVLEGSIKEPENLKIVLKDILPLDKGTQVFTSYELDNRFIDFIMEDEERMDWKVGHIHSHNTMGVFFSGTDQAELNDSCTQHNFYLSLIVNNYLDMTCKIAIAARAKYTMANIPYKALDEEGHEYTIDSAIFNVDKTKMYVYDCEVNFPQERISVGEDFAKKVEILHIPKAKPSYQYTPSASNVPVKNLPQNQQAGTGSGKTGGNAGVKWNKNDWMKKWRSQLKLDELEDEEDISTTLEYFTISLFSGPGEILAEDVLSDKLDMIEAFMEADEKFTELTVAEAVLDGYVDKYDKYFSDSDQKDFIDHTQYVIEILEEEEAMYPFINKTILALKHMVSQVKEYGNSNAATR